jgi:glycosyltransferase involved in cell wall biosynthesis
MAADLFLSGFTFVRNGVQFDYPFEESIRSMLPLVDELVVMVGAGSDSTLERLQALAKEEKKLKIFETVWDDSLREGGRVLAEQTNLALQKCKGKWGLYLQADEVLHEEDYDLIRAAIKRADKDSRVDGILFDYVHFYGDFFVVSKNPSAYRHEVRAVRLGYQIFSWKDAQGFRKKVAENRFEKLQVIQSRARIFHYGWVRPPEVMKEKTVAMDKLYHPEGEGTGNNYQYKRIFGLERFRGTHPSTMLRRVEEKKWEIDLLAAPLVFTAKDIRKVFARLMEKISGRLPFEYKNYRKIG